MTPNILSPSRKNNGLRTLLLLTLGVWSIASLLRIIQFTFSPAGANDLYVYWYAGHFVREGQDPYDAFLTDQKPSLPIHYLDTTVTDLRDVVVPGWVPAPALTFPLIAILSCFSFLSWPLAKLVWLGFNLLFIFMIPPLILRIFAPEERWGKWITAVFILVFVGLTSTRYAGSSGQVTFLVLLLALGSIHFSKSRPYTAGILLGIALSKYSLSIGFFLYLLLFERNFKTTLTALAVQALGLLGLSIMSGTGIVDIVRGYLFMLVHHSQLEGIHLASLFPSKPWELHIAILLSLVVSLPLLLWYKRNKEHIINKQLSPTHRQHLLTVLSLWALLVGYHRAYDVVLYILFVSLGLQLSRSPEIWNITLRNRNLLLVFVATTTFFFMLPAGSIISYLLPGEIGRAWILFFVRMTTLILGAALAATLYLLFRLRKNHALVKKTLGENL
ncbi:MAG: glycosyltransferase family 87 protein [Chloroflexota bacterium]|nr:glycosyltransferase family 87 protein [Chloroflexota bacterium]